MVRHYEYSTDSNTVLKNIRKILESEGYFVREYAPEDGFLNTDYKKFNWGKNEYQFSIIAHVTDRITLSGMGKLDLPTSGMGKPDEIMETQIVEKLPYRLQRRVFSKIEGKFDSLGFQKSNHWP
tara:strand:- start:3041 stop:3412 length:372 start_codon:yes stop_codon:yes gene_type:complete